MIHTEERSDKGDTFPFSLFLLLYIHFTSPGCPFRSNLKTTEAAGTYVTAVFWTAFAAGRFAAIFLAVYVNPLSTLLASLALCLCGGIALALLAQYSLVSLQVCDKVKFKLYNVTTCDLN